MEQRILGSTGLKVPILSFGCGTFGGKGPMFGAWGNSDATEARRLVDICLDAGVTLFDTADAYSGGASEEILGQALKGRRGRALIATKTGLPLGESVSDFGAERKRLIAAVDRSLQRLGVDHVDLLQLHALDAATPHEEVLASLEALVAAGKIRHYGVSNYPAWQLMKAQAAAKEMGLTGFGSHQVYYSLIGREYENELMPLAVDQQIGALVWSPLGWGRLTGKLRRGGALPEGSRLHQTAAFGPAVEDELLYRVVDAIDEIALDTGRSVPQIALNWLLQRPTVSSVIIGARNEDQLIDNLGAAGWSLSTEQVRILDEASRTVRPYPQSLYEGGGFARLNPPLLAP